MSISYHQCVISLTINLSLTNVFLSSCNAVCQGNKRAMKEYLTTLNRQLDELVLIVRTDLTPNERKKINTVLIIDVHARLVMANPTAGPYRLLNLI